MKKFDSTFTVGEAEISNSAPVYFIADIAANHDGDLSRARDLIYSAKEAGAACAKFQHFKADKIVSDFGFSELRPDAMSHQASWKKSVAQIYDDYHTKREWNDELIKTCKDADIEFMTTPYDVEAMDDLINHVNAVKVGSGDITFKTFLRFLSGLKKPIFLATGASDMYEVQAAVDVVLEGTSQICLMQCNTNYTGSVDNFSYVNLNVLRSFALAYPSMPLGFSDHTPGHSAVLGAVALGATVIEKHFTDDNSRVGPDHHFALNPRTWREMVDRTRELELAMGDGVKRVEDNEKDTVIIQRRAIRAVRNLEVGEVVTAADIEALRPCPQNAIDPMREDLIIGLPLKRGVAKGQHFEQTDF